MTTARLRSLVLASVFATAGTAPVAAQTPERAPARDSVPRVRQAAASPLGRLSGWLFDSCRTQAQATISGNGPGIVVSSAGQMRELKGPINEGNSLQVVVMGHPTLLSLLVVARTSTTRVPGVVNVVAPNTLLPSSQLACTTAVWTLRDFAPGIGEIEISVAWPDTAAKDNTGYAVHSLAKIGFPVNKLYAGSLFFGPIITSLANPAFGVRVNGSDSTITTIAIWAS